MTGGAPHGLLKVCPCGADVGEVMRHRRRGRPTPGLPTRGSRVVLGLPSGRPVGVFVRVVAGDVLTLEAHATLPVATELPLRWETDRGPVEATVEVLRCNPLEVRLAAAAQDAPDGRSAPRFAAPLQVRAGVRRSSVTPVGTRVSGALVDVSACGLSFTPNAPLGTGSLVLLTLVSPSGAQCGGAMEAVVLRAERQVGGTDVVGCRFAGSQPDLLRALEAHQAVAAWRRSA